MIGAYRGAYTIAKTVIGDILGLDSRSYKSFARRLSYINSDVKLGEFTKSMQHWILTQNPTQIKNGSNDRITKYINKKLKSFMREYARSEIKFAKQKKKKEKKDRDIEIQNMVDMVYLISHYVTKPGYKAEDYRARYGRHAPDTTPEQRAERVEKQVVKEIKSMTYVEKKKYLRKVIKGIQNSYKVKIARQLWYH